MKTLCSILLFTYTLPVIAAELIPFTTSQRQAMQIETKPLQAANSSTSGRLPGKVSVPNAQLHIVTAPQEGLVETLLVAGGEAVTRGQALAKIQSPALLALQSEYLEAQTRYQLAKSIYDRDQQLNDEGIIAERRLLESRAQYQGLRTTLARIKRMLKLAGMDEQSLTTLRVQRKLDSTLVITAPFDGVILEQMTTAGNRIKAADPLYQIAKLKPLWLEIHMPLEQLANIELGQTVIVPAMNVSGRIITIGKMVHGVDQSVLVRAEIHDGAEKLRPGQFVQVQLALVSKQKNYRVPRNAVIHSAGLSYVFVAQADGFIPVAVKRIGEQTNVLIIEAELPLQTEIAVAGTSAIKSAWLGGQ